jgi:hypothetical protein
MEVQLELAPTPQPAALLSEEGFRFAPKSRTTTELDNLIEALENNGPIDAFLGPDDHVMIYGMRMSQVYGIDPNVLFHAIVSNGTKWFAVLFISQDGSSSQIEAVQNPFQAAAMMSIPASRSKKTVTSSWIARSFIGPFNAQEEAAPIITIWKSHRPQARYEKTKEVAKQFRCSYFFGTVNN